MKRAIVLSGGGAKGGYEIGVWKAFRRLGINFDIVTGTSVGALNGVLMVQNDFFKAYKLWSFMNYKKVMDIEIKGKYSTPRGRNEIISKYTKGVIKGGIEMNPLRSIVDKLWNENKFYNSKISYGLVTTYFPSFKGKYVTKENTSSLEFIDYLMASAACFPAFKMKKIGKSNFIDGGYYDNMPINLAIKLGATDVIAINLGAVGLNRKVVNKNVNIKIIKPRNNLGNFLAFEKSYAKMAIKFGYNDVLKEYNVLDGNIYTFKKNSLKRNYDRLGERFYSNYDSIRKNVILKRIFKNVKDSSKVEFLSEVLEKTMNAFLIDESNIYRTSYANTLIKRSFRKENKRNYTSIKRMIKNDKLNKKFVSKDLICYIYNEMKKDKVKYSLFAMFPRAFLSALYLKTIFKEY